eukprot:1136816_1
MSVFPQKDTQLALDDDAEQLPLLEHHTTDDEDANRIDMKSFLTACAANLYEYYDFALLGFFATEISSTLFPPESGASAIVQLYVLYAVGFIARPFGGIVFGYFGDKYGRKSSLRMAMILMSFPTFLTGCIPGYQYIGWWSPFILLLLRLLQGLSTGGENSSAAIYTYETAPRHKRAFWLSIFGICSSGTLVASLFHVILQNTLNEDQMTLWGWRIPFLLGIGLFLFSFCAKKWLKTTNTFSHLEDSPYVHHNPIRHVCSHNNALLLKFVFVSALQHGSGYLIFVFLPSYLSSSVLRGAEDGWTDDNAYIINSINSVLFLPICVLVGYYADRIGTLPFICFSCGIVIFLAPFLFYGLAISTSSVMNWFLQFMLTMCCVPLWGCIFFWYISELLMDPRTRVTIYGVGYNAGAAVFGGTASLIGTALVSSFGSTYGMIASGLWMSILAMLTIGIVAFIVLRKAATESGDTAMETKSYEAEPFTSLWYLNSKYKSLDEENADTTPNKQYG